MTRYTLQYILDMLAPKIGGVFALLRVCVLLIIIYLAVTIVANMTASSDIRPLLDGESEPHGTSTSVTAGQKSKLSKYTRVLNQQSVFGQSTANSAKPPSAEVSIKNIKELLSDYDILGTVVVDDPRVIILDKKNGITQTLGLGESLGQVEVIAIERAYVRFKLFEETYDVKY